MTRQKKALIVILGGLVGMLVIIRILSRLWPFIALSLLQQGAQSRMHCWVKVVDQNENGVNAYRVEITEHSAPLLPFLSKGARLVVYETRKDGMFEYQSKGTVSFVIFGHWDTQWTLNPRYLLQQRNLAVTSSAYQRGVSENATGYLGSKRNPYLLHVFTVGPMQKLLFWQRRVKLEKEGDYACMDLLAGRIWESKTPEGDVAIADGLFGKNRELPECFHYVVAGANCGVAPVLDDWGLCPPEGGYQHTLCAPKDWEARNWSSSGIQVYYRLEKGKTGEVVYGRLTLGMSPRVQNAEIHNYTNLQGERNLYYNGYNEDPSGFDGIIRDYISPPAP
jgi:hypothetical protein